MNRQDFVRTYSSLAIQETKGTGIFPETLLSSKYNNYFGIKADASWKGPTVTLRTGEVIDGKRVVIPGKFRVYSNIAESFRDYVKFLHSNSRYKTAGVFSADTVTAQASALKRAGYATNPQYAALISNVANSIKKWVTPHNVAVTVGIITALFFLLTNNKRNA